MLQRTKWTMMVLVGAGLLASACNDTADTNGKGEMAECIVQEERSLAWSDAALGHDDIGAYVDGIAQKYPNATLNDKPVTVDIQRGNGTPTMIEYEQCPDQLTVPLVVQLDDGNNSLTADYDWGVPTKDQDAQLDVAFDLDDGLAFFQEFADVPTVKGTITAVGLALATSDGRFETGDVYLIEEGQEEGENSTSAYQGSHRWITIDLTGCGAQQTVAWEALSAPVQDWLASVEGVHDDAVLNDEPADIHLVAQSQSPTQSQSQDDACTDSAQLPMTLTLAQGEATWSHDLDIELQHGSAHVYEQIDDWASLASLRDPEELLSGENQVVEYAILDVTLNPNGTIEGTISVMIQIESSDANSSGGAFPEELVRFSTPVRQ